MLAKTYGYTPDEIAAMSPARQYMLLSDKSESPHFNTSKELNRYLTGSRSG